MLAHKTYELHKQATVISNEIKSQQLRSLQIPDIKTEAVSS